MRIRNQAEWRLKKLATVQSARAGIGHRQRERLRADTSRRCFAVKGLMNEIRLAVSPEIVRRSAKITCSRTHDRDIRGEWARSGVNRRR
jgi:hypothetical protein